MTFFAVPFDSLESPRQHDGGTCPIKQSLTDFNPRSSPGSTGEDQMSSGRWTFKKSDLERAIRVAKKYGYLVRAIAPDGTLLLTDDKGDRTRRSPQHMQRATKRVGPSLWPESYRSTSERF